MTEKTITKISEAISVLLQGVNIAQAKGAFTLDDASTINSAVNFIKNYKEGTKEVSESKTKKVPSEPETGNLEEVTK